MAHPKRLTRSSTDRRIFGVCGGLGEYFNIDSTLFRILFVILMFVFSVGLFPYIILALIMPYDYQVSDAGQITSQRGFQRSMSGHRQDVTPADEDHWSDF
ncbi:PspC domain-containing protein [Facklamia sp. DSM 111018]|uniref:PspC domain-containing protein n=1 Tax=Facklamia lactis TaxID=2749967 RepID=A0ABS0LR87_9LACT|nr:PspC domain-containing protein [Facklamia lactis]MBG9980700.1 PspC domain-containing protein [Facklamia lactis]MBG9986514.1 PspC domain-containing protein [Facklamia lactis]